MTRNVPATVLIPRGASRAHPAVTKADRATNRR